jgi:tetratricopeptide (TPR) repeat protein
MLLSKWLQAVTISVGLVSPLLIVSAQTPSMSSASSTTADVNLNDPDRQEAVRLYKEHKLAEAAEWWQKVVVKYPGDMDAHEALGASLLNRAGLQADRNKKTSDRLLARAELVRAQELGNNSDLCRILLSTIPEDGSEVRQPTNRTVSAILLQPAPAKRDLETVGEYAIVMEHEAGNYFLEVEIGIAYARLKQWDKAQEWYVRALQTAPDGSLVYGNWADMLISMGRMKEAREKLIQGLFISDNDWLFRRWLAKNHLELKKIDIKVPYEYSTGKTGSILLVDPSWLGKDDGRDAWLMYPRTRRLWKNEKYFNQFHMNEFHMNGYRHSMAEEVDALSQVVAAFNESLAKGNVQEPDPDLMLLSRFQADGLLEAFVVLAERDLDQDLSSEVLFFRIKHRDKLMEFADKYIVPPLP